MKTKNKAEKSASVRLYNEDCLSGAKKHISSKSVDLIICDPPFGIEEGKFKNQYNRVSTNILPGYFEAPTDYYEFTKGWLGEAKRILRNDGSMYIISGWSQLQHVLNAISYHGFNVINHLIWKYNFEIGRAHV